MIVATMPGTWAQLHVDSRTLTSAGGEWADLKGVISLTVECMDLVQMLASVISLLNFFSPTSFPHKVQLLHRQDVSGIYSFFFLGCFKFDDPTICIVSGYRGHALLCHIWIDEERHVNRASLDIELDQVHRSAANRTPIDTHPRVSLKCVFQWPAWSFSCKRLPFLFALRTPQWIDWFCNIIMGMR